MKIVKESPYVCSYSPEVIIVKYNWLLRFWTSLMAQWQRIRLPVQETWVRSLHQKDPLERKWQPSVLAGKSLGQRSLAGYSPWSHKALDMT